MLNVSLAFETYSNKKNNTDIDVSYDDISTAGPYLPSAETVLVLHCRQLTQTLPMRVEFIQSGNEKQPFMSC